MATTDPLIGATIYNNSDPALGGQQIGDVANDIVPYTIPRFTSTSTRDSAYATYVAGGGVINNGMTCWVDSPGCFYDRIGGAWKPRPDVAFNTTALDGTSIPANARIFSVQTSYITTVSNTGGGFQVLFGFTFTKLLRVMLAPGDTTGGVGAIVPIAANHTASSAGGVAYQPNGSVCANGSTIRVEVSAVGYVL